MKSDDLIELAERVERATGPDRELDRAVAEALGWTRICSIPSGYMAVRPGEKVEYRLPKFSRSMDAAMTLAPKGFDWCAGDIEGLGWASISPSQQSYSIHSEFDAQAATPALALTAACLRARASMQEQDNAA